MAGPFEYDWGVKSDTCLVLDEDEDGVELSSLATDQHAFRQKTMQLSIALLAEICGDQIAMIRTVLFREAVILKLPEMQWEVTGATLLEWSDFESTIQGLARIGG
jgi:hypothetical protein